MRAPLSWLRDFAPLDAPVEVLATTLSQLGLVVDGVTRAGSDLGGVVVARVASIRPHPDADRIRLVDVDAGGTDTVQVACGAWNFAEGDLVPLATVGTVLPGGMEIGRRKMRGQWSEGMLCAPRELDLPEGGGEDGLMILPPGLAPPGTALVEALELGEDVVFDLDITPNRPDALCMAGVARDLAAGLGEEFRPWQPPAGQGGAATAAKGSVTVRDPDLCGRFTATVVTGVPHGPSPRWLARRLTLAGMRPLGVVVDVSNYVMLELGQPNHPYDLERLPGRGLIVRRARPGETLVTLDGVSRVLAGDDCLICDGEDNPVGLAGIMGGESSGIGTDTTTVLLEAAWFNPVAIARTGKRVGVATEARARFERGVDPTLAPLAVERFVDLLAGAGADVDRGPTVDVSSPAHLPAPARVRVRTSRINLLLGTDLADADVPRLLEPIGFAVSPHGAGASDVQVPPWRPDASREADVIEEVGRLHGYSRIERTLPRGIRSAGGLTGYQRHRRRVRDVLAGAGLSEAWTTTFLAPGDLERAGLDPAAVEVENPLDRSESVLRTSLLPGLLKAARYNADRQWPDVRLFEVGRVFLPPPAGETLPVETEQVAAIMTGAGSDGREAARTWAVLAGALRLRSVEMHAAAVAGLHPTRSATLAGAGGETLGAVGEVDPDVASAYGVAGRVGFWWVDLGMLVAQPVLSTQAVAVSRYPASDVDLAFVVPGEVPAAAVRATLAGAGGSLLEWVRLFDIYPLPQEAAGTRSLAYRLRFRAPDRTLTDAEVADARQAAIDAVTSAHPAKLRA